jgi:hypothetical protein
MIEFCAQFFGDRAHGKPETRPAKRALARLNDAGVVSSMASLGGSRTSPAFLIVVQPASVMAERTQAAYG